MAEKLVANGKVDVVAIGKAALANKKPAKAAKGEPMEEFNPENFFTPNARIKDFEL